MQKASPPCPRDGGMLITRTASSLLPRGPPTPPSLGHAVRAAVVFEQKRNSLVWVLKEERETSEIFLYIVLSMPSLLEPMQEPFIVIFPREFFILSVVQLLSDALHH